MIRPETLRDDIIVPTLVRLDQFKRGFYSRNAVSLMLGIAAQETDLGYWFRQHPTGPGKGIWSVEDQTFYDIVNRYLARSSNRTLRELLNGFVPRGMSLTDPETQVVAPQFACAVARIRLWMVPAPIPDDLEGQAKYWDKYYHADGESDWEEYVNSWHRFAEWAG